MFKIVNKEIEIDGTKYVLREKPKLVEVFIAGKRNDAERGAMFALEKGKRPIFKEVESETKDLAEEMKTVAARKSMLSKAKREYVAEVFEQLYKPEGEEETVNGIYINDLMNMFQVMPDAVFMNKNMKSDVEGFMKKEGKFMAVTKPVDSDKYYLKEIGEHFFYAEAALSNLYDGWEHNAAAEKYFMEKNKEQQETQEPEAVEEKPTEGES